MTILLTISKDMSEPITYGEAESIECRLTDEYGSPDYLSCSIKDYEVVKLARSYMNLMKKYNMLITGGTEENG